MAGKYIDVIVGEIYLKKIFSSFGVAVDNLDITAPEIDYAETWAENRIDSRLGLSFPMTPATPLIIRDIALLYTSYQLRRFLVTANSPNLDDHTQDLKEEADEMMEDIFHGRRSVIMPDLSFHPRYPGPSGGMRFSSQGSAQLKRFFTNMDRPFVTMEQMAVEAGIEGEYQDTVWGDPDGQAARSGGDSC